MPPTLNERLSGVGDDLLRWSALARSVLRPEQRAMRFDAFGRETPLDEQMLSPQDIDEAMRAQGGGIAVRVQPPSVMYHGSRREGLRTLQSPKKPIPAWFAEQPSLADEYANWGGAGTVYRPQRPVQLQNPLVLTKDMNSKAKLDDIRKDSGLSFRTPLGMDDAYKVKRWEAVTSPEFVEAARAAGYDGIRVSEGGHATWGLFAPTPVVPPGVRQQRRLREPAPLPVPRTQMDFWGRGE